jgi:hypothetical protein
VLKAGFLKGFPVKRTGTHRTRKVGHYTGKRSQEPTMFIKCGIVYMGVVTWDRRRSEMPSGRRRAHKHFRLDPVKIKRAQRVLRADTETEAIERALDLVISEHERNRLAAEANERFVKSGIDIKDVYGALEP